jgi:hypothetical protein
MSKLVLFWAVSVIPLLAPFFAAQKWGWRGLLGWNVLFLCFCWFCAAFAPKLLAGAMLLWLLAGFPSAFVFWAGGPIAVLATPQLLIAVLIAAIALISGRWPDPSSTA